MGRPYGKVLDVKIENGELKIVIAASSLPGSNSEKYNPRYPLSPEQLTKYGIR